MTRDEPTRIAVREHPLLRVAPFITRFPAPLGALATPPEVLDLLRRRLDDDRPGGVT